jgi:hypothetical protein
MDKYCENCGTRLWANSCPNCDEEYCIIERQCEFLPEGGLSIEFLQKAAEGAERTEQRRITNIKRLATK